MSEGTGTKRETPAREWLVLIAVGLVMALVGVSSDYTALLPVGLLLAVVAVFGLLWRLLGRR